jgi:hypothetical protein
MKRATGLLLGLAGVAILLLALGGSASGGDQPILILRDAATGKLKPAELSFHVTRNGATRTVTRTLPFISPSAINAAEERLEGADATAGLDVEPPVGVEPNSAAGCGSRNSAGINVRVNQDCTFRRQAEEENSFNPADPSNLIAGQNDSRVGFNQCGIDWSTDAGATWGDLLPPFRQHLNSPQFDSFHTIFGQPGTLHTYDAASDPTTAFDAAGNGYFSCVIFDVFSNANGLFVTQSPAVAKGSFFFNIPATGSTWIVAEDNSGPGFTTSAFHDKQFITTDTYGNAGRVAGAQNNVYVTWTVFFFDNRCGGGHPGGGYCQSPIFGSMSTNGGRRWSPPEEISGSSPTLCFFGNFFDPRLDPHACNFDQGSDPIVLPNGKLVVPFNNGNTPAGNPNGQQLAVVCSPSGSTATEAAASAARLHCGAPAKVGDDIVVNEPRCDFGRGPEECIPGAFIRTNDFPRSAVNTSTGALSVTWQDYRNARFDIQLARSTDGGATWSQLGTVNPVTGADATKDHYFPAVDVDELSGKVGDSYFRTDRVPGENTTPAAGFCPLPGVIPLFTPVVTSPCQAGVGNMDSDYVLSAGTSTPFAFTVVSPSFRPPDGVQAGFNGDYSGLTITPNGMAHPVWSDTRNSAVSGNSVVHDEDIFTDSVALP